jgi:hypothetical protein
MIQPAGCKLTAAQEKEINVLFTGTTLSTTSGLLTGAGGSAEEFASLTVEAEPGKTCAATGTFTVNGGQLVETPEGGSEKVEHEIVAKNTGSMLTLGGNAAKFSSTAKVMLASGAGWFITGSGV